MIKTVAKKDELSAKLTYGSKVYQRASRALFRYIPIIPSQKKYNLTLSHEEKFIWFRVPKVGMSSILNLLMKSDIMLDAEYASKCHYPDTLYKDYFKFALVRNPWDRLVSCWKDKVLKNNHFNFSETERLKMKDFKNFVEFVAGLNIRSCDRHLKLQSELIDLNNIDFLGRFESFNQDLSYILQRLGIENEKIENLNPSGIGKNYKEYYDDNLIEKVGNIYERDIMFFHYDF